MLNLSVLQVTVIASGQHEKNTRLSVLLLFVEAEKVLSHNNVSLISIAHWGMKPFFLSIVRKGTKLLLLNCLSLIFFFSVLFNECRIYGCEVLMFRRHIKQHAVQLLQYFFVLQHFFETIKFFHQVQRKERNIHEIRSFTGALTLLHEIFPNTFLSRSFWLLLWAIRNFVFKSDRLNGSSSVSHPCQSI